MKTLIASILMALGLASAIPALAAGQQQGSGYLLDGSGQVVKNPFGLCWRTGYWTPAMATKECDPELLPKPAPAPKPAPVARKPVTEKVTLSSDTLFDFNKANLRPDGKAKLDDLAGKIKAVNVDTIIAIGYTDRIGSKAYNLKLSKRRADSVKAYLVSRGIAANRIYTEGKGKANPVTKPGQCKGRKSPKVIKCLQPDRRVEIQVIGTRTQ